MAAVALTVTFLADGRCSVARLKPRATGSESSGSASLQASGDFHCPLPYRELGSTPIDLRVVLAPGLDRPADSFPRLDWRRDGDAWVGTAALPSAPSFVGLNRSAPAAPAGAGFGWNFYGFFVFAVAFIAIYLVSVRWTRRGPAPAA